MAETTRPPASENVHRGKNAQRGVEVPLCCTANRAHSDKKAIAHKTTEAKPVNESSSEQVIVYKTA